MLDICGYPPVMFIRIYPAKSLIRPVAGKPFAFLRFPPKTLINISYLFFGTYPVEQIISYVGWQEGVAERIPVILQRIWPGWFTKIIYVLLIAGLWVAINFLLTLIRFLAEIYWK